MKNLVKSTILIIAAAVVLGGCASTTLTEQWKEPTYQGPTFRKILVIGATDVPARRRTFENEFSKQLDKRASVDGIPSFSVLETEGEVDRTELEKVVRENGIDAVLVTRLIGTEQNIHYTPGTTTVYPYGWYGGMYDYYYGAWGQVSSPGYLTTSTTVRLETNVYAVSTEKLVWAGITESFSPSNVEQATAELAAVIIKSMGRHKLI